MLDLLVLGDRNPDLILTGAELEPKFVQAESLIDGARLVIRGSGAITACGAAKLGGQPDRADRDPRSRR